MAVEQEAIKEEIPLAERILKPRLESKKIEEIEKRWLQALGFLKPFKESEINNQLFCGLIGGLVSIYQKIPEFDLEKREEFGSVRIYLHDREEKAIEIEYLPQRGKGRYSPRAKATVRFSLIKGREDHETGMAYSRDIIAVGVGGETSTIKAKGHPKENGGWVLERDNNLSLLDVLKTVWAAYQYSKVNNRVGG